MKKLIFCFVFCISYLFAQYVNNPYANTVVAQGTSLQTMSKVVLSSTGRAYISWLSYEQNGYKLYLQKLDSSGFTIWGPRLIEHISLSFLTDYSIQTDAAENVIIVVSDARFHSAGDICLYKFNGAGEPVFGENGMMISNDDAFEPSPQVLVTAAGNILLAWQNDYDGIKIEKLSQRGTILWTRSIAGGGYYSLPQIVQGEQENFYLVYYKQVSSTSAKRIIAHYLDVSGQDVFSPVEIYADGGIEPGYLFQLVGGNSLGIAWVATISTGKKAFVQKVSSNGILLFQERGAIVTQNDVDDVKLCNWGSGTYLACSTGNFIDVQKVESDGFLAWGNNGRTVLSLSPADALIYGLQSVDNGIMIFYGEKANNSVRIYAQKMDEAGNLAWYSPLQLASRESDKKGVRLSNFVQDMVVFSWQDMRNGSGDIFVQNLHFPTTLGNFPGDAEIEIIRGSSNLRDVPYLLDYEVYNFDLGSEGVISLYINGNYVSSSSNRLPMTLSGLENGENTLMLRLERAPFEPIYPLAEDEINLTCNILPAGNAEASLDLPQLKVFPNPFNPITKIIADFPRAASGEIAIFDIRGRKVKVLQCGNFAKGENSFVWNGKNSAGRQVGSGIYLVRSSLKNGAAATAKLTLAK